MAPRSDAETSEQLSAPVKVRIVTAAIAALELGGEAGIRVDRIAEDASVAKASIYSTFGDRDGLIIAAQAERYREAMRGAIDEYSAAIRQCATADEFADLIRSWMIGLTDADGAERRRVRVEVLGTSTTRPELQRLLFEVDRQVAREVANLLLIPHDRGWIDMPFNLEATAQWWYGMLNGRYLIEQQGDAERLQQWDEVSVNAMLSLLFASR